ncbi:hypothetical protein J8273_7650 [Carpediemonas membranifera]|uniref:Uncharacterized protein n=1 Tax=Carpediemonas membranifera TaxID=201153 RepID=A0A8J6E1Z9_9EUKA|nr:hypothetical protein J8273_7650 [Carpediemonas membranifera]|eukprot:KAG9391282.1 hypothetical protein J8273_7650 [Carpediemonas membranifera]
MNSRIYLEEEEALAMYFALYYSARLSKASKNDQKALMKSAKDSLGAVAARLTLPTPRARRTPARTLRPRRNLSTVSAALSTEGPDEPRQTARQKANKQKRVTPDVPEKRAHVEEPAVDVEMFSTWSEHLLTHSPADDVQTESSRDRPASELTPDDGSTMIADENQGDTTGGEIIAYPTPGDVVVYMAREALAEEAKNCIQDAATSRLKLIWVCHQLALYDVSKEDEDISKVETAASTELLEGMRPTAHGVNPRMKHKPKVLLRLMDLLKSYDGGALLGKNYTQVLRYAVAFPADFKRLVYGSYLPVDRGLLCIGKLMSYVTQMRIKSFHGIVSNDERASIINTMREKLGDAGTTTISHFLFGPPSPSLIAHEQVE